MNEHKKQVKKPPAVLAARRLPSLPHYVPGRPFNIMESQAAEWLSQQPEIRQHIWNMARRDGSITLDIDTGTWRGVDYRRKPPST